MPERPRWDAILATSFVFEKDCWTSCGGYCCDIRHGDFRFNILPAEGASILHPGDEYDWMRDNGRQPPESANPREICFDFGGPRPLRLVAADCTLKGHCAESRLRPLHCRLYPFFPIFDVHGGLADIYPASIFDLTRLAREGRAGCDIWNDRRQAYLEAWRRDDTLDPLRHPRLMLYFAAYKVLADNYVQNLNNNTTLAKLSGADFWRRWELLYLGRRLFDIPALKKAMLAVYLEFAQAHGDVL